MLDMPIRLDFNYGKGFTIGLDNPLEEWRESKKEYSVIKPNDIFESAKPGLINNDIMLEDDDLPF